MLNRYRMGMGRCTAWGKAFTLPRPPIHHQLPNGNNGLDQSPMTNAHAGAEPEPVSHARA